MLYELYRRQAYIYSVKGNRKALSFTFGFWNKTHTDNYLAFPLPEENLNQ